MKPASRFSLIVFGALMPMLLNGCFSNRATISVRHFVLAPISTNAPVSQGSEPFSVGISPVKMPPYLLRYSMAVRTGYEIEYLEDARWGERLDQNLQHTLAANLAFLIPAASIYQTDWPRDEVSVRTSIVMQQFEVDNQGQGVLIAQWRITAPDSDAVLKSGNSRLVRPGPSPQGKPEVIAETLSELAAEFSRELARSIRESVTNRLNQRPEVGADG